MLHLEEFSARLNQTWDESILQHTHDYFNDSKHLIWVEISVFLSSSKNIFYGNPRASSV